jgi:ELWxxDGT repeat protein
VLLDFFSSDSIVLAGDLYFRTAPESNPCTLYKVNASDAKPLVVRQLTGMCESELVASEATLFFLTREEEADPFRCTLWRSDGTAAGTLALKTLGEEIRRYCPSDLLVVNGQLFMIVPTAAESELWISDGTQAGTYPVKILDGVTEPLSTSSPIQANGIYFVVLADKAETCGLWRSDGTPEGTFPLKRTCVFDLTRLDETVIFTVYTPGVSWDVWRSDGTLDGTVVVSGFFPEPRLGPELIEEINGELFWLMRDRDKCSLWQSRGIQSGMTLVAQLCPTAWTSVNGSLFFVTQKNEFTIDLWQSDGTSSGTTLIRTIP